MASWWNQDALEPAVLEFAYPDESAVGFADRIGFTMRIQDFSFGSIQIDGKTYEHDVVIDRGEIKKRKKKPSKRFRDEFGHTSISIEEKIPWKCRQLIIGNGVSGALPVMDAVKRKAKKRGVELIILSTPQALERLNKESPDDTNAILHVTC
jgi:hypothetical protein